VAIRRGQLHGTDAAHEELVAAHGVAAAPTEAREEQPGLAYVLWLLVLGGLVAVLGVAGLFRTPPELDDILRQ
jgi:hypothetical protein